MRKKINSSEGIKLEPKLSFPTNCYFYEMMNFSYTLLGIEEKKSIIKLYFELSRNLLRNRNINEVPFFYVRFVGLECFSNTKCNNGGVFFFLFVEWFINDTLLIFILNNAAGCVVLENY